jgi:hypothetical protein
MISGKGVLEFRLISSPKIANRCHANTNLSLEYLIENHGDHESCWIILKDRDTEKERYNMNAIEYVRWL